MQNSTSLICTLWNKWAIDCCLMPTQQFVMSFVMSSREQVNFQWYDHVGFYIANSLKQQSADRHVATLGYIVEKQQVHIL